MPTSRREEVEAAVKRLKKAEAAVQAAMESNMEDESRKFSIVIARLQEYNALLIACIAEAKADGIRECIERLRKAGCPHDDDLSTLIPKE